MEYVCEGPPWRASGVRTAAGFTHSFLHITCLSPDRKCQEANEKVQELQARQEARADQEQRIRVSDSFSDAGCVWGLFPSCLLGGGVLRVPGDGELPAPWYR